MNNNIDNRSSIRDRRSGNDRRISAHVEYFPERRCGYDQRNGIDRRRKQK